MGHIYVGGDSGYRTDAGIRKRYWERYISCLTDSIHIVSPLVLICNVQGGTSFTGTFGNGVTVVTFPIQFWSIPTVAGFTDFAGDINSAYVTRINNITQTYFQWDGHALRTNGWFIVNTEQNSNGISWVAFGH